MKMFFFASFLVLVSMLNPTQSEAQSLSRQTYERYFKRYYDLNVFCFAPESSCKDAYQQMARRDFIRIQNPLILTNKEMLGFNFKVTRGTNISLDSGADAVRRVLTNTKTAPTIEEVAGKISSSRTDKAAQDLSKKLRDGKVFEMALFLGYIDDSENDANPLEFLFMEGWNYHGHLYSQYRSISFIYFRMFYSLGINLNKINSYTYAGEKQLADGTLLKVKLYDPFELCPGESITPSTALLKRGVICKEQKQKSIQVRQEFEKAIKNGVDFVSYSGHARHGLGPDFSALNNSDGRLSRSTLNKMLATSKTDALMISACKVFSNYRDTVDLMARSKRVFFGTTSGESGKGMPTLIETGLLSALTIYGLVTQQDFETMKMVLNSARHENQWPFAADILFPGSQR